MKTIATVLLAVAITVMIVQGFSWILLAIALISAVALVFKGLASWMKDTFESG